MRTACTYSLGLALSVLTASATTIELVEYDSIRLAFKVDLSTSPGIVTPATVALSDGSQIELQPYSLGFTASVTAPNPFSQTVYVYFQHIEYNNVTGEKLQYPSFLYSMSFTYPPNGQKSFLYSNSLRPYSMTFVMGTPLPISGEPYSFVGVSEGGSYSWNNESPGTGGGAGGPPDDGGLPSDGSVPDAGSTLALLGYALFGVSLLGSCRRLPVVS